MNGEVAGEASPIGELQATGKLILLGITGHKQMIAEITVLGKVLKLRLESSFRGVGSVESTDETTASGPVEVS